MSSITIASDATIWSVTYDRHYDNHNSFIIQATGLCKKKYIKIGLVLCHARWRNGQWSKMVKIQHQQIQLYLPWLLGCLGGILDLGSIRLLIGLYRLPSLQEIVVPAATAKIMALLDVFKT